MSIIETSFPCSRFHSDKAGFSGYVAKCFTTAAIQITRRKQHRRSCWSSQIPYRSVLNCCHCSHPPPGTSTCHSCPHHTVSWQDQRTEALTLFAAPGKAIAGAHCKFNRGKDPSGARSCSRHMPAAKRKEAPPALSCRPLSYREDTKPQTIKTIQKGNRTNKGRNPLHFMPSPKQSHTQQHRQPSLTWAPEVRLP